MSKINDLMLAGIIVGLSGGISGCSLVSGSEHSDTYKKDIVGVASEAGTFSVLEELLNSVQLTDVLKGEGPFTVFAPTDEAFSKIPSSTIRDLKSNPGELKKILLFHVVPMKVDSSTIVTLNKARTAAGIDAHIELRNGSVFVAGAKVVKTDIEAANGFIHVLDSVMIPQDG